MLNGGYPGDLALRSPLAAASSSSRHSESVFFAIKPDANAADAILRTADQLCHSCGLAGKVFDASTLHITLCEIGKPKSQLAPLEKALANAGAAVRQSAFDVVLDRAKGFNNSTNGFPNVLLPDAASSAALAGLRRAIVNEQFRQGLVAPSSYTPHLTLSRASNLWTHDAPIDRITWRATEFLLIHSYHDGRKRCHDVMERWALTP